MSFEIVAGTFVSEYLCLNSSVYMIRPGKGTYGKRLIELNLYFTVDCGFGIREYGFWIPLIG